MELIFSIKDVKQRMLRKMLMRMLRKTNAKRDVEINEKQNY